MEESKPPTEQTETESQPIEQTPPQSNPPAASSEDLQVKTSEKRPFFKSKLFLVLLGLVIIVAGAGLAYVFTSGGSDDTAQPTVNNDQSSSQQQPATTQVSPNTIAYAYRDADTKPYSVYWRSAAGGGERTLSLTLAADEYVGQSDTSGANAAFSIDNFSTQPAPNAGVWFSSDGGKKYTKIYELAKNEQITSLKFSSDGKSLVMAVLPQGQKNTVKSYDLSSKKVTDLFTADTAGVFIEGYNSQKSYVVYFEGCYNCGGGIRQELLKYDIAAKSQSTLLDLSSKGTAFTQVSLDTTTENYVFATATVDTSNQDAIGISFKAPYTVEQASVVNTNAPKVLSTFTNTQNDSVGVNSVGFLANANSNPYWAFTTKLYAKGNSSDAYTLYEANKTVVSSYFASSATVIAAEGTLSNFVISNFDVANKKATVVLNGDINTVIFGITTN